MDEEEEDAEEEDAEEEDEEVVLVLLVLAQHQHQWMPPMIGDWTSVAARSRVMIADGIFHFFLQSGFLRFRGLSGRSCPILLREIGEHIVGATESQ